MEQRAQQLHTSREQAHTPSAVLAYVLFEDRLVWVLHPSRGWELPGGKIEPGETPEDAVRREVWEETGITVGETVWFAEYALKSPAGQTTYKWVYVCVARDVQPRPASSEILDVQVFTPVPDPVEVQSRPGFSYIVKDEVYEVLWPQVRDKWIADAKQGG